MKTKYFFLGAVTLMMLSACSEDVMDDINKDNANPPAATVDAKFQLTDAIMSTGFTTISGNNAWYAASYTEQIFGTGNNQLMQAELRNRVQTAASTTYNNEWNGTYSNLLNLKQAINKTEDGKVNAGQKDIRGIAQVLWAINFGIMTDLFGDIPYSDALQGSSQMQPKLDKQEDIYNDLLKRVDEAVTLLGEAAAGGENHMGAQDLLFRGNPAKWQALAHAVKARLLMNTLYRNPSVLASVVEEAQAAFDGGFSGAELTQFNGVDCDNPWTAFFWSRLYSGSCETVADIMAQRNDPRLEVYAVDGFGTGVPFAPAGDATLAKETMMVGYPAWLDNGAATVHIFSLSELHFLMAEAKARLGQDASESFAAGIEAAFDDYAASDPGYTAFDPSSAAEYIASLGAPTLQEVMVQKYIAQARDEQVMTYTDLRRCRAMGEEHVKLQNPNNTVNGANNWPLRFGYGNSDVISNPNVAEAFGSGNNAGNYIFTENVWLFGGTR